MLVYQFQVHIFFRCCSSSVQDFLPAKEMEFDDDEYNENRIMPPPKSFNRMDEDWDTDDGQFAMGFEDDMEDEDLENMDNIEAMELLLQFLVSISKFGESKQVGLGRLTVFGPLK